VGKASRRRKAKREAREERRRLHIKHVADLSQRPPREKPLREKAEGEAPQRITIKEARVSTAVLAVQAAAIECWDTGAKLMLMAEQMKVEALIMYAVDRYVGMDRREINRRVKESHQGEVVRSWDPTPYIRECYRPNLALELETFDELLLPESDDEPPYIEGLVLNESAGVSAAMEAKWQMAIDTLDAGANILRSAWGLEVQALTMCLRERYAGAKPVFIHQRVEKWFGDDGPIDKGTYFDGSAWASIDDYRRPDETMPTDYFDDDFLDEEEGKAG